MPESKKYYLTTAIDYVNAAPHIGHALEKIQADVVARHRRLKGDDVFFLTGADEHGVKIVRAAAEEKKDIQEFVDENHLKFKAMKDALDLSWDDFIRTSDRQRHWPGAQKLWMKMYEAGDLYKKKYRGLYCVGHEAFVTEKDLIGGKCVDHHKEPEIVEEENWFFRLSKYLKDIEIKIKNDELRIIPESRKNEILSFMTQGLEDVSFSRPRKDLQWGIPVPNDAEHTMYVWCDALANYITAIGYGSDKGQWTMDKGFEYWWPADAHFIGKDILRFHAAIWPGMLLSASLPLPKAIFVHGFITVDGRKMSKTVGNVISPFELAEKYGSDAVRYYLLSEIPSGEDGDFNYHKFEKRYNGNLAHGLGNFAARVLTLGAKLDSLTIEDFRYIGAETAAKIKETHAKIAKKIDSFEFHEALAACWDLISFGDKYVNKTEPWKTNDRKAIIEAVVILDNVAAALKPFLPVASEKITSSIEWMGSAAKIQKIAPLFPVL